MAWKAPSSRMLANPFVPGGSTLRKPPASFARYGWGWGAATAGAASAAAIAVVAATVATARATRSTAER